MSQSPTAPDSDGPERDSMSDPERHRLLASDRRRALLDLLEGRGDPVDLVTAAEALVERERPSDAPAAETVEQVSITLHHRHLPLMDEVGLVDYDPAAKTVDVDHERLPL